MCLRGIHLCVSHGGRAQKDSADVTLDPCYYCQGTACLGPPVKTWAKGKGAGRGGEGGTAFLEL